MSIPVDKHSVPVDNDTVILCGKCRQVLIALIEVILEDAQIHVDEKKGISLTNVSSKKLSDTPWYLSDNLQWLDCHFEFERSDEIPYLDSEFGNLKVYCTTENCGEFVGTFNIHPTSTSFSKEGHVMMIDFGPGKATVH